MNLVTTPRYFWAIYPISGWGLGLFFCGWGRIESLSNQQRKLILAVSKKKDKIRYKKQLKIVLCDVELKIIGKDVWEVSFATARKEGVSLISVERI